MILPVSIVLIVFICRNRALAKKTDVIKLAIEKGADLDVDKMMEALSKTSHKADKPVSQLLLERLVTGIVLFLSGIAILLVWLLVRRTLEIQYLAFPYSLQLFLR